MLDLAESEKDEDERRMHTDSMQVAAMERRKLQEEQKVLKRFRDDEKRREMAAKKAEERQRVSADKLAQKQEKVFVIWLNISFEELKSLNFQSKRKKIPL